MDVRETIARVMHKVCGVPARKRTWGSGVMLLFDIGAARRQQQRNLLGCNAVGRAKALVTGTSCGVQSTKAAKGGTGEGGGRVTDLLDTCPMERRLT